VIQDTTERCALHVSAATSVCYARLENLSMTKLHGRVLIAQVAISQVTMAVLGVIIVRWENFRNELVPHPAQSVYT
jgi:hypothetical protein